MKLYVLGFAFNEDNSEVLLIKKNRPAWQAGKWNGVGGKIEDNESAYEAMVREFKEETNLEIHRDLLKDEWIHYCTMNGSDFIVHVYASYFNKHLKDFVNMTDEKLTIVNLFQLVNPVENRSMQNIPWLVNLALDPDIMSRRIKPVEVYYDYSLE